MAYKVRRPIRQTEKPINIPYNILKAKRNISKALSLISTTLSTKGSPELITVC